MRRRRQQRARGPHRTPPCTAQRTHRTYRSGTPRIPVQRPTCRVLELPGSGGCRRGASGGCGSGAGAVGGWMPWPTGSRLIRSRCRWRIRRARSRWRRGRTRCMRWDTSGQTTQTVLLALAAGTQSRLAAGGAGAAVVGARRLSVMDRRPPRPTLPRGRHGDGNGRFSKTWWHGGTCCELAVPAHATRPTDRTPLLRTACEIHRPGQQRTPRPLPRPVETTAA